MSTLWCLISEQLQENDHPQHQGKLDMATNISELTDFIEQWQETEEGNRRGFMELLEYLQTKESIELAYVPRDGLTYSLRVKHHAQQEKSLFVMVDVIEAEPRWLSVCFYADMITDPDEKGDFVPGGLLGEDARCFDLETYDKNMVYYLKARIDEAWTSASQ